MVRTFIGIGQCGCTIIDTIFEEKNMFQIANPIAINSDVNDLKKLRNLGRQHWIGISREEGFIEGTRSGFGQYVTGGCGNYPENAEQIITPKYSELKEFLKKRVESVPSKDKDKTKLTTPFALIAVGAGGGTGSGTAPFVAKALKELYNNIPILVIMVLPASKEGKHLTRNAWRCIEKLTEHVDGFVLVDNEKLTHKKSIEYHIPQYNRYIARCITDLIAGIIIEKIDLTKLKFGREFKDIDFKDIVNTSSFQLDDKNKPGFAVIGRASRQVRGLPFYMPLISMFPSGYRSIEWKDMLTEAMSGLSLELKEVELERSMKNLVNIRMPDHYLKNETQFDTESIKNYMQQYSRTGWRILGISRTKRYLASITVLLTFQPNEIQRLIEIEGAARNYNTEKGIIDYEI